MKQIYERRVWSVFEKMAHEIKVVKVHLYKIERIATKYVLEDRMRASKCQRKK